MRKKSNIQKVYTLTLTLFFYPLLCELIFSFIENSTLYKYFIWIGLVVIVLFLIYFLNKDQRDDEREYDDSEIKKIGSK